VLTARVLTQLCQKPVPVGFTGQRHFLPRVSPDTTENQSRPVSSWAQARIGSACRRVTSAASMRRHCTYVGAGAEPASGNFEQSMDGFQDLLCFDLAPPQRIEGEHLNAFSSVRLPASAYRTYSQPFIRYFRDWLSPCGFEVKN
jgi:hypothetical protein